MIIFTCFLYNIGGSKLLKSFKGPSCDSLAFDDQHDINTCFAVNDHNFVAALKVDVITEVTNGGSNIHQYAYHQYPVTNFTVDIEAYDNTRNINIVQEFTITHVQTQCIQIDSSFYYKEFCLQGLLYI